MSGQFTPGNGAKSGILVIGMGNVLMQDEGVGVRAVEEIECNYHIPDSVQIMDGGTTGTELLAPMRNKKHLIIADAVNTGAPPGTLVRMADEQVPAFFQTKISNHQLGLCDLLALLQLGGDAPQHVTIVGMVPHSLENRLGLSRKADTALVQMVAMLVGELEDVGVALAKRANPRTGFWASQARLEGAGICA